jgi:fructose-1-phosphate kinase PfkB-like protein
LPVVSLGAEGIVISSLTTTQFALSPSVEVRNPTGAGDCLVGGFAFGLERRLPLDQTIRIGVACGAASVGTEAPGAIDIALVKELENRVLIHERNAAVSLGC